MKLTNDLDPYARDQKGRWKKKTRWEFVIFWIFFIGTVGAYIGKVNAGGNENSIERSIDTAVIRQNVGQSEPIHSDNGEPCTKTPDGSCSFATKENLLKWQEYLESEVEKLKVEAGKPTAILTKVCRSNGITDSNCPKILYAMAQHESIFGTVMVGDHGKSEGWFHILNIHKNITKDCKYDLECSANWSLKRMIGNGFKNPETRWWAIGSHNSQDPYFNKIYVQAIKNKLAKL